MLKVKINDEIYAIKNTGEISTMERQINPQEWKAKEFLVERPDGLKTVKLKDFTLDKDNNRTYLRSEDNGQPKLLEVTILSVDEE